VLVGDVTQDPRYLTTFGSTRSEVVVPIFDPVTGTPTGIIDVESERLEAFTADDCAFLEACASRIAVLWQ
jgi:putative methionine-R-sulfoxide reductase with GAF domain